MNADSFLKALQKRGFKELGEGAFCLVYGHPDKDFVYKFTGDDVDVAWLEYAKLCRTTHKDNPFAPKIHWVRETEWGFIAKIEKLDKTICQLHANDKNRRLYHRVRRFKNSAATQHELADEFPDLAHLMEDIHALGYHVDLHDENVMIKDDRFVITDPVC